ncbi:flavin reductase family protein [Ancylobacter sonchi]|uniref:flavin reductase family protein n=1 Tax=Ancylobacter sonchi TaxID=1937790 RepID=UPI001BD443C0|nr:flavin reductase family protein [Ancylobacter sonchi]MBS7533213.1 flavin reductase family protein [Ancylobacter sonchi]
MNDLSAHRSFRNALGRFATGVTVVTSRCGANALVGLTISSFNAVSLDPPLVLWSLSRRSRSLEAIRGADGFIVNVLAGHQSELAMRFARGGPDDFDGVAWEPSSSGHPVLGETVAHFVCVQHAEHDGGDHVIFLGRVVDFAERPGEPLIFAQGRFSTIM